MPLFETVVVFENYPIDASLKEPRQELKFSHVRSQANTNYPLTLIVKPGNELALQFSYDSRRFDPITTEILDAPELYFAEDYHQQYLAKNPSGYCGLGGTGVSCPIGLAEKVA